MNDGQTATIIPFPGRYRSADIATPAATPADAHAPARLSVALAALSDALQEQRAATQRWRDAMTRLSASLQVLRADSLVLSGQAAPKLG